MRLAVAVGWIPKECELDEIGVEQLLDGLYFALGLDLQPEECDARGRSS